MFLIQQSCGPAFQLSEMPESDVDDLDPKSGRKDGRRPLLVYMHPDLIKQLKKLALDRDVTTFSLVEEAVQQWMGRQGLQKP